MLSLIFAVAFAILVATFAVQNRNFVDIRFGSYLLTGVPVYLLVLASIFVTLLLAGVLFVLNNLSHFFSFRRRNNTAVHENEENERLVKRVHDLENENARLKSQPSGILHKKPYFFRFSR